MTSLEPPSGTPPGYDVPTTRIGGRSGRTVVVSAALAIVGLAAVLGVLAMSSSKSGPPTLADADVRPTSSDAQSPTPTVETRPRAVVLPPLSCDRVAQARCREIAVAAVAAIDDPALPAPTHVEVSGSILCGDNLDCPVSRLVGHHPAGSAIVSYAPNTTVWVNVVEPDPISVADRRHQALEAWVIHSSPG